MWLFFIFVAVPVVEIALFIKVGGWLGLFPTLAIIVITAALGTYLVKTQAISTFSIIKTKFSNLQNPTEPVAHAAMIANVTGGLRSSCEIWFKSSIARIITHGSTSRPAARRRRWSMVRARCPVHRADSVSAARCPLTGRFRAERVTIHSSAIIRTACVTMRLCWFC